MVRPCKQRGRKGRAYRIHLSWDWVKQEIVEMNVTDHKTGESLKLYDLQAGDIVTADRGCCRSEDCQYVLNRAGEIVIRYAPQQLTLVAEAGAKFNLAGELWETTGNFYSRRVRMQRDAQERELYLHGYRLPPEKVAEVRRKKKAKAKPDERVLRKETLEYAEWTLILTSFEPTEISAAEIGKMYRLRWQQTSKSSSNDSKVSSKQINGEAKSRAGYRKYIYWEKVFMPC